MDDSTESSPISNKEASGIEMDKIDIGMRAGCQFKSNEPLKTGLQLMKKKFKAQLICLLLAIVVFPKTTLIIVAIGKTNDKINAIKAGVLQQDATENRNIVNAQKPMGNGYHVASSYVDPNDIAALRNALRFRVPANDLAKEMRVKAILVGLGQEIFF
jgi:hypothetical protein